MNSGFGKFKVSLLPDNHFYALFTEENAFKIVLNATRRIEFR